MNLLPPAPYGVDLLSKFGENPDIDTGTLPEDIWDAGGAYAFPAAAAATTIVSDSANDASAGTGARTVTVFGLDANYLAVTETVTLNGTTPVALTKVYLRVHRAYVATAGTGGTNAGTIQIKHGATVIAQIAATHGQTLMAIYTIPADYEKAYLTHWVVSMGKVTAAQYVHLHLEIRPQGGAWRTLQTTYVVNLGASIMDRMFTTPVLLAAKTDVRVRALEASANDISVASQFDMVLYRKGAV